MGRPVVALLGVLAAGCVTASVYRLDQDLRPPCSPDAVQVPEQAPDGPYTVIAHRDSQPIILVTGMIMSEEKTLEADVIVFDRPQEDAGSGV